MPLSIDSFEELNEGWHQLGAVKNDEIGLPFSKKV